MTENVADAEVPSLNLNKFSHLARNPIPTDFTQEDPFLFYVLNIEGETDKESSSPDEGNMRVRLYGVNQYQNTVLAYVDGFLCHIAVEYPSYLDDPSDEKLETIKLVLDEEFRKFSGKPEVTAISKVIFQGSNELHQQNSRTGLLARYLTLYLTNPKHLLPFMKYFNALEENKDTKYPKPVLEEYQKYDYFNMQFLYDTGLRLLTWVQLEPNSFEIIQGDNKKSTCQIEIKTTVEAFSLSLVTKPDLPKPFLRILSFDIECDYIPGESNDATKLRKAIQIANVFSLTENEPQYNKNIFTFDTCDKIDGADVYWYHKEADLLSDWKNFIMTYDPDVITGYNINKFDFSFLLQRGRFLHIENIEDLSRQKEANYLKDRKTFALNGRLVIDLLGFMQDMNPDLENMKLNTVAQVFLNEEKEDVSYNEISEAQNLGIEGRTKLATYCIQDSNLVLRLFMKLQVLEEITKKTCQPAPVLHRHALQRKTLPKTKRKKEEENQPPKTPKEGTEGGDNAMTMTPPPTVNKNLPEISSSSSSKEDIEKFLLQRASNYLVLKGSTNGYEDYNQRLKEAGSQRLFIKLHDKNKTTFITGYLEGEAFETLSPHLNIEQDLLITNFQLEQVLFEVEHKVIKIFKASIIDMNQQGVKILELMTRVVCLNPLYLIVNKDLATAFKKECQNINTCFDCLAIQEPDTKMIIEEKPVASQPAKVEVPKKPKQKIDDYFKTSKPSLQRSNTDPVAVSKKEEFLGKRSLSLLPTNELTEKHEPGIEKKIKNEATPHPRKIIAEEEFLFSKLDLSQSTTWKIKGRVIGKTKEIQVFHERVFKPGFILEIIDESGQTISAVFLQKEAVENYFNKLNIGYIYLLSGGTVINKTFPSFESNHELQLYFDNNSYTPQIQPQENRDFPQKTYNFDSIPSIQKSLLDSHAYIIGVVTKVTFENLQRKDKPPQTVRKLIVSDQDQNQVEVMMWEELKDLTINRLDLVCILQAKVKEFNKSKYLGLSSQSQVFVNYFPSQETFQQLYDWTFQLQKDRVSYLLALKSKKEDKSCTIQDLENWKEKNGHVEIRGYIGRGKAPYTYESCKNCKRRIDPDRQNKVTFLFGSPSDAICEESSKRAIKLEQVKQGLTDLLIKYSNHDSLKKCDYCSLSFAATETTTVTNYALGDYTSLMNIKSFANMPNILGEEINAESELKELKIKVKITTEFSKEKSYTIMGTQPIDFVEESLDILNLLEKYKNL